MKIIVDSNRVVAALIKESTTRKILFDSHFEFSAPDFILQEIEKHKHRIAEVSGISEKDFEVILELIFGHIDIVPRVEYEEFINQFKPYVKDEDDIAYLATCLATKSEGVWTHDPHFKEQKKIKVFTNIDMLRIIKENGHF